MIEILAPSAVICVLFLTYWCIEYREEFIRTLKFKDSGIYRALSWLFILFPVVVTILLVVAGE